MDMKTALLCPPVPNDIIRPLIKVSHLHYGAVSPSHTLCDIKLHTVPNGYNIRLKCREKILCSSQSNAPLTKIITEFNYNASECLHVQIPSTLHKCTPGYQTRMYYWTKKGRKSQVKWHLISLSRNNHQPSEMHLVDVYLSNHMTSILMLLVLCLNRKQYVGVSTFQL